MDSYPEVLDTLRTRLGRTMPAQTLNRVAALVGTGPIDYADSNAVCSGQGPYAFDGQVLVMTPGRVIEATLAGSLEDDRTQPGDPTTSVAVRSWSRRTLSVLAIEGGTPDEVWNEYDPMEGWHPSERVLHLTYRGGELLHLPCPARRGAKPSGRSCRRC